MIITVREAVYEDIPRLCALEEESFSSPWSERSFEDFFANGCSHCLVAEVDGYVVGYVGMNLILGEGEITNIAVSAGQRRHGVGGLLMEAVMKTPGLERIMLDVRESNTAARGLYEKLGFSVDGIRRSFYEKPREDAVLMSRYI